MRALGLGVLALVLAGCPGGGGASGGGSGATGPCFERPLEVTGMEGMPLGAQILGNTYVAPVTLGKSPGRMLFDTGAPITFGDPTAFTGETFASGVGAMKLQLGTIVLPSAPVVNYPAGLTLPDGRLGGIVGGDVMCHFLTRFDAKASSLTLGEAALPSGLDGPVTVKVPVMGGGKGRLPSGEVVDLAGTRIIVKVNLEGTERTLMLDSGASYTVLTDSLFTTLTGDGRKTVNGLTATTVMGSQGLKLARARRLAVGTAVQQGGIVATGAPALLAALQVEVGSQVDGLLGGTFLREFLVSIDYRKGELTLARYQSESHVKDEMVRAGVILRNATGGGFEVGVSFAGTDAAAKGLSVGTKVTAIDGKSLAGLDAQQVDGLLLGAVGDTRTFTLASGDVAVKVEDVIAFN
ncbi:MAG: aspartyl protease family protein [Myxococcaceae bacterium]|nr:aspartyl protease family protein [Myxococcaceae bacterium]